MSDDYPDSEWPFPFFFNGEELSPWSAQWHLGSFGDLLHGFVDDPESDWDEFVSVRHIWHLQCRIDHIRSIESEDAGIFHVCAQEVLKVMLMNRSKVVESIEACDVASPTANEIFLQMAEGIAKMLEICARDRCAIWTSGYDEDRKRVIDCMRRSHLPRDHPSYLQLPHEQQRHSEQEVRARFQLSDLRSLLQKGGLEKRLRQLIHQLPQLTGAVADQLPARRE